MHKVVLKLIQGDRDVEDHDIKSHLIITINPVDLYEVLTVLSEEIDLDEGWKFDLEYEGELIDHIAEILEDKASECRLRGEDRDADFVLYVLRSETKSKMYFTRGNCGSYASWDPVIVSKHNIFDINNLAKEKRLSLLLALTETFLSSALQSSVGGVEEARAFERARKKRKHR
jgi:hypothetical protein